MSFVKSLVKGGMFGLGGLAASGAFKDKKKPSSLINPTATNVNDTMPSLISQPAVY